jgi:hypothetical protein
MYLIAENFEFTKTHVIHLVALFILVFNLHAGYSVQYLISMSAIISMSSTIE